MVVSPSTSLNAGIPVVLVDTTDEFIARGRKHIEKVYAGSVEKGKLSQEDAEKLLAALTTETSYDKIKDADIVIEAVFEDMKIKKSVFEKIEFDLQTRSCAGYKYIDSRY